MKKAVYVVTMYRYGDRQGHSYVLGVFSTKTKAEKAAEIEQAYCGGTKYYPEAIEVVMDAKIDDTKRKVIVELKRNPYFS